MSQNNAVPTDTSYMRYFRLDSHDAQCLTTGDRFVRDGRLVTVTECKHSRGGTTHVLTLDSGYQIDVARKFDHKTGVEFPRPTWMESVTIFRPRVMFNASPINSPKRKAEKVDA